MKFGLSQFFLKTPDYMRTVGDIILATVGCPAIVQLTSGNLIAAKYLGIIALVGKVLVNLSGENE